MVALNGYTETLPSLDFSFNRFFFSPSSCLIAYYIGIWLLGSGYIFNLLKDAELNPFTAPEQLRIRGFRATGETRHVSGVSWAVVHKVPLPKPEKSADLAMGAESGGGDKEDAFPTVEKSAGDVPQKLGYFSIFFS